jgi:hypothetical protein
VSKHTAAALFGAALSLGIAFIGLALILSPPASAQEADDASLRWAFADRGILADDRVSLALSLPVDIARLLTVAGRADLELHAEDPSVAEIGPDLAFAAQLLDAAGIPAETPRLQEVRRCRVWVASAGGPGSPTTPERESIAVALSDELARVLPALIGREIEPCVLTTVGSEADILVYAAGDVLPIAPENADSFLRVAQPAIGPSAPQPRGAGGALQALPASGSGGLAEFGAGPVGPGGADRGDTRRCGAVPHGADRHGSPGHAGLGGRSPLVLGSRCRGRTPMGPAGPGAPDRFG